MDERVVRELNGLTKRFYARFGESFSDTRQAPWPGWEQLAEVLQAKGLAAADRSVRMLDVGCGNCRFERFLLERFPQVNWDFFLVDNAPVNRGRVFVHAGVNKNPSPVHAFDVVEGLLAGEALPFADADLTVAFGLMHHIPTDELREAALAALISATRPGGLVAVTFWQFLSDPALAAKARATTVAAAPYLAAAGIDPAILDPQDCILGWQDAPFDEGAMRYCHHFGDNDVDRLVDAACAATGARLATRWRADGRTGSLNTYAVIER